jgi:hypothetical protein
MGCWVVAEEVGMLVLGYDLVVFLGFMLRDSACTQ